ncbi:hypothetical protein LB506_010203 [Fusarium annulatum]|nr:hypothetical protein LB506_010203 [Fusarium annulatum]
MGPEVTQLLPLNLAFGSYRTALDKVTPSCTDERHLQLNLAKASSSAVPAHLAHHPTDPWIGS